MSYNILADLYADSDYSRDCLFNHCPTEILSHDYRKPLLIREILGKYRCKVRYLHIMAVIFNSSESDEVYQSGRGNCNQDCI